MQEVLAVACARNMIMVEGRTLAAVCRCVFNNVEDPLELRMLGWGFLPSEGDPLFF